MEMFSNSLPMAVGEVLPMKIDQKISRLKVDVEDTVAPPGVLSFLKQTIISKQDYLLTML